MLQILAIAPAYRWTVTLAFVAVVIALSIAPGIEQQDDSIFGWLVVNASTPLQKVMHVAVYATLAGLWMWTLEPVESRVLRAVIALVFCVALGSVLEWQQTRVPGRFGTLADVLLNVAGTVIGLIAALLIL